MEINYQTNSNECGLCVLSSLISHYHHKKIEINTLLNQVSLDKNGLNIYDFEILAQKYSLVAESYEIRFNEFIELDNNKFFVLLLNSASGLHYVIAKKHKKHISIYCSSNGYYELNMIDLQNVWTGIYIDIQKNIFENCELNSKNVFSLIDWKFVASINLVNLVIVVIAVFNATFFKNIIEHVINNNNMANMLTLVIIFFSTYLLKFLGDFFIEMITKNKTFRTYRLLHYRCIKKLNNKFLSFFKKIDYNNLLNLDEHLYSISYFYNVQINKICSDILLIFICVIIIIVINFYSFLLILALLTIIIFFKLIFYFYIKRNDYYHKSINNKYHNYFRNFLSNIQNNQFEVYKTYFQNNIFVSHQEIKNIYNKNNSFIARLTFLENVFQQFLYILIIMINIYFIVSSANNNIATLSLLLSLSQMMVSSSKSLFDICLNFISLKYSLDIFKNVINVDNKNDNLGVCEINQLDYIFYNDKYFCNDTLIYGDVGSGKTTILHKLSNMIQTNNDQIFFNNINISNINNNYFKNNFVYLSNKTTLIPDFLTKLFNSEYQSIIFKYLNEMKIKNFDNLSLGQNQVLVFLSLLEQKNKIILLDEVLSNVDTNVKHAILNEVKPILTQNNFLIFVSHDRTISSYFANEVSIV